MMNILKLFSDNIRSLTYQKIIIKLIFAFSAVSLFETAFSAYDFFTVDYFSSISLISHLIIISLCFIASVLLIDSIFDPYLLLPVLCLLFYTTNGQKADLYFAVISSIVVCAFVFYFSNKMYFPKPSKKATVIVCTLLGTFLALFIGGLTIIKFLNHRTPNFDFGIFSQMFHYMKNTLVPYTTCERDMLLSHFSVHFSPILYLALPFYCIFPNPSTILAVQAFVVALGIVPIYLLSKHYGLSNAKILALVSIYVFHPIVIAQNFYYFHENCFLTVLLLWLFYFAEKRNSKLIVLFAFLVMMVKEDAPIYVFFFGLFLLLSNKDKLVGAVLSVMSASYFAVVTSLMSVYGNGIMTYRYENFLFEKGDSIYNVVLNIIKNPSFLFTQLLSTQKLEYLIYLLVPMALLPLAIKKPSRIVLLLPTVLINLMTNYQYQFNIGFQYSYATIAFLFYLTVINISELSPKITKKLLLCGMCASLIFFASANLSRIDSIETYQEEKEEVVIINDALATIPKDASIKSSTFFMPALWNRNEIYELSYSDEETDYVVIDLRFATKDYSVSDYQNDDSFEEVYFAEGIIAIYKRK